MRKEHDHDPVNHPKHYHRGKYEAIKVISAWGLGFNLGNAIKYIARADLKGGLEDLQKARWYINYEIRKRQRARPKSPKAPGQTGDRDTDRKPDA